MKLVVMLTATFLCKRAAKELLNSNSVHEFSLAYRISQALLAIALNSTFALFQATIVSCSSM